MKRSTIAVAALTAALLVPPATAQGGPGGPEGGAGPAACPQHEEQRQHRLEEELNLTPEQKQKLHALRDERKAAREEHIAKMKEVRQKMKEELAKEKPDGKTLMKYATQTADLVEQMTKQRIDHLLKVKQVLSKEQFEKLLSKEMMEPGKHPDGGKYPKRHGKKGPPTEGSSQEE